MKRKMLSVVLCLFMVMTVPIKAQFQQDEDDLGVADSVDMVFSVVPDAGTSQLQVQMDLYVFNDSNNVISASMGFQWDNPNLQMDSAVASAEAQSGFNFQIFLYKGSNVAVTNADQQFLFAGTRISGPGVTGDPTRQLWASYYFTLSEWSVTDSIVLDTIAYNSGTVLKFIDENGTNYAPWTFGHKVIYDPSYTPPSNLVLSEDSLYFSGVEDDVNPPAQSFDITSDNDQLNFSLFESSGWLIPTPTTGTTPALINVQTNILSLSSGVYFDSIRVTSAGADNSPQFVYVTLEVTPSPPEIGVSSNSFYFNAIAGGADPTSQILTITNTGGEDLNWTVSNSETWLELLPVSGFNTGDVTLTAHITGLAYGEYDDTVIVSDPTAVNDPVKVSVHLSVGSDLPIIVVDSAVNYWVVDLEELNYFDRAFGVRNGGAGLMNFWIEHSSPIIFDITPESSTAPDSVTITFAMSASEGEMYIDTIWVHSNEAINSPQRVVLRLRFTEHPQYILPSTDTLVLELYECGQGLSGFPPGDWFYVNNAGGDNPMLVEIDYESDLFTATGGSDYAPVMIEVSALDLGLPVGSYFDTIMVISKWAINNPQYVIVQYNVVPGDETPDILLSRNNITIPYMENSGPAGLYAFDVWNRHGGCMPWYIDETIDWLFPLDSTGDVPGHGTFFIDPVGYVFGEYPDSFLVVAPAAGDSLQQINLLLRVWRFHGDVDYNAFIDISDITELIRFLFLEGPIPIPTYTVGDCDCDAFVDINDLTVLIMYLFQEGPMPCGNPYK